jgi:hypothetical protein
MNEIVLNIGGGGSGNDIERISDEMKNMKDELHKVWINNYNIDVIFSSVKLLLVTNVVCVLFMFLITILFALNK